MVQLLSGNGPKPPESITHPQTHCSFTEQPAEGSDVIVKNHTWTSRKLALEGLSEITESFFFISCMGKCAQGTEPDGLGTRITRGSFPSHRTATVDALS